MASPDILYSHRVELENTAYNLQPEFRKIATSLDDNQERYIRSRNTGATVAAVGTGVLVASAFFTMGASLLLAGAAAAAGGTALAIGAFIYKYIIEKEELEKVEKMWADFCSLYKKMYMEGVDQGSTPEAKAEAKRKMEEIKAQMAELAARGTLVQNFVLVGFTVYQIIGSSLENISQGQSRAGNICRSLADELEKIIEISIQANPVFCRSWEVSQVFKSDGGLLQKLDSDVRLLIPPGAIKSGSEVTVHAAVMPNLEHLYGKLKGKLKEEEVIVSPAAEYWVGKDWKFEKPVIVILPHILPYDYTVEDVRVYHITRDKKGGVSLSAMPNRDSLRAQGGDRKSSTGSFRIYRDFVTVQTNHFSSIICTYCTKKGKVECHPQLYIRGCGTFDDCGPRQVVHLKVIIWDKRLNIRDFMQPQGINIAEYQEPVLIGTSSNLKEGLRLRLVMSEHYPELRHCQDTKGVPISPEEMRFDLHTKLGCQKCIKKDKYGMFQHSWYMELPLTSPKINGIQIFVHILMEPLESTEDKTSVDFMLNKNLPLRNVAGVLAEQIPATDETITYMYVKRALVLVVAENLGRDGTKTFFLRLGLSDNQFEEINVRNMSLCDKNFELLKKWCQSPQARNDDALQSLKASLKIYDRRDLAEIVDQYE